MIFMGLLLFCPQAPSNASDRAALKALERENALLAQTIAELRAGGAALDAGSGEFFVNWALIVIIQTYLAPKI